MGERGLIYEKQELERRREAGLKKCMDTGKQHGMRQSRRFSSVSIASSSCSFSSR